MKRKNIPSRLKRFIRDITTETPFVEMIFLLVILWQIFAGSMYYTEKDMTGTAITSYGKVLY